MKISALLRFSVFLLLANSGCVGGPDGGKDDTDTETDSASDTDADADSDTDADVPNLEECFGEDHIAFRITYSGLDSMAVTVIATLLESDGFGAVLGAESVSYTNDLNDRTYFAANGEITIVSSCELANSAEVRRLEIELLDAMSYVMAADPDYVYDDVVNSLCYGVGMSFYSAGMRTYHRAYVPGEYSSNPSGYIFVPEGEIVQNFINVCGFNDSADLAFDFRVNGDLVFAADNPGGNGGDFFYHYKSFEPMVSGTSSFLMDNFNFGCVAGCDGRISIFASAIMEEANGNYSMMNGETSEMSIDVESDDIGNLVLPE